jgi:hypothetical protein
VSQGLARSHDDRCFACGRRLGERTPRSADTRDGQWVYVGSECAKYIEAAGEDGWQPPRGGPRLFRMGLETPDEGKGAEQLGQA